MSSARRHGSVGRLPCSFICTICNVLFVHFACSKVSVCRIQLFIRIVVVRSHTHSPIVRHRSAFPTRSRGHLLLLSFWWCVRSPPVPFFKPNYARIAINNNWNVAHAMLDVKSIDVARAQTPKILQTAGTFLDVIAMPWPQKYYHTPLLMWLCGRVLCSFGAFMCYKLFQLLITASIRRSALLMPCLQSMRVRAPMCYRPNHPISLAWFEFLNFIFSLSSSLTLSMSLCHLEFSSHTCGERKYTSACIT